MLDLIQQFEEIRDLPYFIPTKKTDPNFSCSGKAWRLKKVFTDEGLNCRYRVCEFNWSDLNLPNSLLEKLAHDDGLHVYLEIKIKENWLKLDPTWDRDLSQIFRIAYWNGKNNPPLAVKPLKIYSPKKSLDIMENPISEKAKHHHKKNELFFKALNDWLEKIRQF